jgi:DNA-binding transcriptional LysR family regulator
MQPGFDMDALRAALVGTDLGSFAQAAARLGRSQSAISMQLKKLEQQAGRPLFRRSGRGLVTTEAGDGLLAYARRIIALNDEAAAYLGAPPLAATVRIGIPQDFVEDVLPDVLAKFAREQPHVHLEVHAGRNYALGENVRAGRLDIAIAFSRLGADTQGTPIASMPMLWLGRKGIAKPRADNRILRILLDHPCLFRQTALQTLEEKGLPWRLSLTTPSLPGMWAAIRSGLGISTRTAQRLPSGIRDIGRELGLPPLPSIELRMHAGSGLSPAALALRNILDSAVRNRVIVT